QLNIFKACDKLAISSGSWLQDEVMATRGYALLLPSRVGELKTELPPQGGSKGTSVTLHVYSVSASQTVRKVNRFLGHLSTGAFHTAVEVHGKEWSYGFAEKGSGVFCCNPKESSLANRDMWLCSVGCQYCYPRLLCWLWMGKIACHITSYC
ncbi:unnamed protein product, partial [Durusdinium trenchii]